MNDSRGTIWRKWDFHFHTPSSYDYQNKSITNKQIIEGLKKSGISAVVITDHHIIDVDRILELQRLASNDIAIFPGIELRSELGGSESIHLVGIFSPNCALKDVWTKLQGSLKLTPSDIGKVGNDKVYIHFEDAAKLVHDLGGVVSVHAGSKSNSIENISNTPKFKQQIKKDLALGYIDLFDVGTLENIENYRQIVFPSINRCFPLVICSDNHNINDYNTKAQCWVKANLTIEGLKHAIIENETRFFIGDIPEKLQHVHQNSTQYIDCIEVKKKNNSTLKEAWFDTKLNLNSDLIAIIGNKGSGKSALADILGLLGNSKQEEAFSFLNTKKFREPRNNKAQHFLSSLTWQSGTSINKGLNDQIDKSAVEAVKYIPQNYLETICNDISSSEENSFDKELKKVIFSHVNIADRLGKKSLDELLSLKTSEVSNAINSRRKELTKINQEIIEFEEMQQESYQRALKNQQSAKQAEIAAHEKRKPQVVEKPKKSSINAKMEAIVVDVESAKQILQNLTDEIKKVERESGKLAKYITALDTLKQRIENFRKDFEELEAESSASLKKLGIDFGDIIKLEVKTAPLVELRKKYHKERKELETKLDPDDEGSLIKQQQTIEKKISKLNATLDEPNKKYAEYEKALRKWQEKKDEIMGSDDVVGSLKYIEGQLASLLNLPDKLKEAKLRRDNIVKIIFSKISELADIYRTAYQPVQRFIEKHKLAMDRFNLNFQVSIVDVNFREVFLDKINQRVSGSFMRADDAREKLSKLFAKYDLNKEGDIILLLNEIVDNLTIDKSINPPRNNSVQNQLKKGTTVTELYDYLFSLSYLKPKYSLTLGDKQLSQLSPGEKGMLLLVFYLLVDKDTIPLILDQPEENLDNQTVYEVLVPCIKEAKNKRQIVIVTHNPNLAVVCDADQIICAKHDKKDNEKVTYISGAIEDANINKDIVDILEGTKPAFDNRDAKYLTAPQ